MEEQNTATVTSFPSYTFPTKAGNNLFGCLWTEWIYNESRVSGHGILLTELVWNKSVRCPGYLILYLFKKDNALKQFMWSIVFFQPNNAQVE